MCETMREQVLTRHNMLSPPGLVLLAALLIIGSRAQLDGRFHTTVTLPRIILSTESI